MGLDRSNWGKPWTPEQMAEVNRQMEMNALKQKLSRAESDIDTIAGHNVELQLALAAHEAEIVKLREALLDCEMFISKRFGYMASRAQIARMVLSTPQSTSYLEQWVTDNFEVNCTVGDPHNRVLLYARKESK